MATIKGEDFSFKGMRFLAKMVDCYDGDTLRMAFIYNDITMQYSVRMLGYDSPEMRPPKSNSNRDEEVAAAKIARDALKTKIGDGLVYMVCGKFDKYGRPLVTLHMRNGSENGENINEWMMVNKYGTPYAGGKKMIWSAPEII